MSAQTIQRGFNKPNSLISAAKEKENSFAYSIKKFFYTLFMLGSGKAMEKARSERRENEIVGAAFDILNGLPKEHKDLTKSEFDRKILHTNFYKKYQLIQEREELCLYTGHVSRSPLNGKCNFDKDMHSRTVLKKFSGSDFSDFKTELNQVKAHPIFKTLEQQQKAATKIQSAYRMSRAKDEFNFLSREITFYREFKIKGCKNNLTLKQAITFYSSNGEFNNSWEASLANINAKNFDIQQIELVEGRCPYKIFNINNSEEYILVDERGGLDGGFNGELRGIQVLNLIRTFFINEQENKTLKDFLDQPVKINDSPQYKYLLNGAKNTFKMKNKEHIFSFFKNQLDRV